MPLDVQDDLGIEAKLREYEERIRKLEAGTRAMSQAISILQVDALEIGRDFFRGEQGFLQLATNDDNLESTRPVIYFVPTLQSDPSSASIRGQLQAEISTNASVDLVAYSGAAGAELNLLGIASPSAQLRADGSGGNAWLEMYVHVTNGPRAMFSNGGGAGIPVKFRGSTTDHSVPEAGDVWHRSNIDNGRLRFRDSSTTQTIAFLSDITGQSLGGDVVFNVLTKSTAYEASPGDFVLVSGTTTITLPENAAAGSVIVVKKTDSGTTSTVSRKTADTIDGGTTYAMTTQYEAASFLSDGANWFVF